MALQSGTYPTKNAPLNPKLDVEYLRQLAVVINNLLIGKSQNTGEFTLNAGGTTTTVINAICSKQSVILLMPKTEHAAQDFQKIWIPDPESGQFVVNHNNDVHTDRTFGYIIIG